MKRLKDESFVDYKERRRSMQFIEKQLRKGTPLVSVPGTIAAPGTREYKRIMLNPKSKNAKFLDSHFKVEETKENKT